MTEPKRTSHYLDLLKQVMIFSFLLALAAVICKIVLPSRFISPALFFLFPFFISVTLITAYILIRASGGRFMRFLNIYMIITLIKLFLFIGVLVAYILLNRGDLLPFAGSFMILYFLYTIFEVVWLVRFSKESRT